MIEKAVMEYLLTIPSLTTLLKGQIYYRIAPSTVKMPYCIITNSGGMRQKLTQTNTYSQATDTLTLYIDDSDKFRSKDISNAIVNALENYRGTLGGIKDCHFRFGTTRDLNGFQGAIRQLLTIYVTYRIDVSDPIEQ